MKNVQKKIGILTILAIGIMLSGVVLADFLPSAWELPGLNFVTRAQWGADESWRIESRPEYQARVEGAKKAQEELEELRVSDPYLYAKRIEEQKRQEEIVKQKDLYMSTTFKQEVALDAIIRNTSKGDSLRRNQLYKLSKDRIVIHHTAINNSTIKTQKDSIKALKDIYRFHAFGRGRGDVGYNFVIDPMGTIYEGRAGGQGVVGAHASYNNIPTIGIALMGDFTVQKPTVEQLKSLTDLVVSLSRQYQINPFKEVVFHKESANFPYIKDVILDSIIGHKDVGSTSCPGPNLYSKIEDLKSQVSKRLLSTTTQQLQIQNVSVAVPVIYSKTLYLTNDQQQVQLTLSLSGVSIGCSAGDQSFQATGCSYKNGVLTVQLKKIKEISSGPKVILIQKNGASPYAVQVTLLRKSDIPAIIQQKKTAYFQKINELKAGTSFQKIQAVVSLSDIKKLSIQDVRVLLYNASLASGWSVVCPSTCYVQTITGVSVAAVSGVVVMPSGGQFLFKIQGRPVSLSALKIIDAKKSPITLSSLNGTKKQIVQYRGSISFLQGALKTITGKLQTGNLIVNTVAFDQYLAGIGESLDSEHPTKKQVLALLAKMYMLFYMDGRNQHPSIPMGAIFNAIDDPRLFQKYIGYTAETINKTRKQALNATSGMVLLYRGGVPILPYFHCSAGFTRSAQERRGRSDTPYLQSQLDVASCDSPQQFEGHGVGLSGKGAQLLASQGLDLKAILAYYFPGVQVVQLGQ